MARVGLSRHGGGWKGRAVLPGAVRPLQKGKSGAPGRQRVTMPRRHDSCARFPWRVHVRVCVCVRVGASRVRGSPEKGHVCRSADGSTRGQTATRRFARREQATGCRKNAQKKPLGNESSDERDSTGKGRPTRRNETIAQERREKGLEGRREGEETSEGGGRKRRRERGLRTGRMHASSRSKRARHTKRCRAVAFARAKTRAKQTKEAALRLWFVEKLVDASTGSPPPLALRWAAWRFV